MALEDLTGTKYLNALVATNPDGATDYGASLDNHVRGLKNVLLKTFANITGAVTATHTELNLLASASATVQTLLGAANAAAVRAAIEFEATLKGVARLFTTVQTPSFRTHTVSADTAAVAWDMAVSQTLFLVIDAAGTVTITVSNVTKGAMYNLHVTNTTTGQTIAWAGATVTDGINVVTLDNTVGNNFMSFFAESTSVLKKLGQENYT